jgi:hypothetical protein
MIRHHLTIPGLLMAHIELPRALEDYFAFAETTPTRNGRRFVLSFPYFSGELADGRAKLDRLQWWFHLNPAQERQLGEAAVATIRAQATERFRLHIERWLQNTRQRLHGDEPIPRIDALNPEIPAAHSPPLSAPAVATAPPAEPASVAVQWPADKVANG